MGESSPVAPVGPVNGPGGPGGPLHGRANNVSESRVCVSDGESVILPAGPTTVKAHRQTVRSLFFYNYRSLIARTFSS